MQLDLERLDPQGRRSGEPDSRDLGVASDAVAGPVLRVRSDSDAGRGHHDQTITASAASSKAAASRASRRGRRAKSSSASAISIGRGIAILRLGRHRLQDDPLQPARDALGPQRIAVEVALAGASPLLVAGPAAEGGLAGQQEVEHAAQAEDVARLLRPAWPRRAPAPGP